MPIYEHPVSTELDFCRIPMAMAQPLYQYQQPSQNVLFYSGHFCGPSIGYRLTKLQWSSIKFSGLLYIFVYVILESFEHCNSLQVALACTLCGRMGLQSSNS